jgi:riboflavin kinase/FMN adenylyltransferase
LLNVKYLLVGDDFKFGKDRTGDFNFLKQYTQYFAVEQCETLKISNERVSSSLIRQALQQADFLHAQKLLGRPYTMKGRVIRGNQRGRTIGFPTANIAILRKKSPLLGVYAVKIHVLENETLFGVANLGSRPTVDASTRVFLEVHIFDYDKDIYGKFMEVDFVHKLRDEKKFDSFELLKEQIFKDAEEARLFFDV